MNTTNPTTNPTTPSGPATAAAPDGLVVGKKYKSVHDSNVVWITDERGAHTINMPVRDRWYLDQPGLAAAIASGELVPADDEPATMTDAEAFESFPAGKGEWSDDIYAHTEMEGAMLDAHRCYAAGHPKGVCTCPICVPNKPLSDHASKLVAAHTTPGKSERFGCRIVRGGDWRADVIGNGCYLDANGTWGAKPISWDGNFNSESEARAALAKAPPPPGWVEVNVIPPKPTTSAASTDLTDDEWSNLLATIEEYRTASGVAGITWSKVIREKINLLLLRRAYGRGCA